MTVHRAGTWDDGIWGTVETDYPAVPRVFAPHDVVLDAGAHTGGFAALCAARGARVVGFEAAFENFALANINLRPWPRAEVRWGALWRSDTEVETVRFHPPTLAANTGGGNVLFDDAHSSWSHEALVGGEPAVRALQAGVGPLSVRDVPAVPLDSVLRELGGVRLLKIDVEGAEFPILLTSRELGRVEVLVGEIHELTPAQQERLPERARVGSLPYTAEACASHLRAQGFEVSLRAPASAPGQFLFHALRRRGGG